MGVAMPITRTRATSCRISSFRFEYSLDLGNDTLHVRGSNVEMERVLRVSEAFFYEGTYCGLQYALGYMTQLDGFAKCRAEPASGVTLRCRTS